MPILNVSSRRLHRNAGGLWCRNEKSLASSVSRERISLIHLNHKHPGDVCVSPWTLDIAKYPISFVGSSFSPINLRSFSDFKADMVERRWKGHKIPFIPRREFVVTKLHASANIIYLRFTICHFHRRCDVSTRDFWRPAQRKRRECRLCTCYSSKPFSDKPYLKILAQLSASYIAFLAIEQPRCYSASSHEWKFRSWYILLSILFLYCVPWQTRAT